MKSHVPTEGFFKTPNDIIDKYIPYIGTTGFTLYASYCRLYNKGKGFAYPSVKQTARTLGLARNTVFKYNALLEEIGLIKKGKGVGRMHNQYKPLKPSIPILNKYILKHKPVP